MLALLPLGASAADPEERRASGPPPTTITQESVVVTATREPRTALSAPASVSRIGGEELAELSAKHQAEALNELAGVYIQRGSGAENPYRVQHDLQKTMQELVGIVRTETEMVEALGRLGSLRERASRAGIEGHREYNAGWHTCLDLRNLLDVSEAIARSAIERKESRGGHFREDYPDKTAEFGQCNIAVRRTGDGSMQVTRVPLPEMPAELKQVIEEQKQ